MSDHQIKQDKYIAQVNKFLTNNPGILKKIPKNAHIIPVDADDSDFFKKSMKNARRMIKKGHKNVLVAIRNSNKDWDFHKQL